MSSTKIFASQYLQVCYSKETESYSPSLYYLKLKSPQDTHYNEYADLINLAFL